jgi:hypothetical protein
MEELGVAGTRKSRGRGREPPGTLAASRSWPEVDELHRIRRGERGLGRIERDTLMK